MGNSSGIITAIRRMEELTAVRAVRSGLVNMIPVLIILMIYWGTIGIVGPVVIGLILITEIIVMVTTPTNSLIHDLLANTVAIDEASQKIFETPEELAAFKAEIAAETAHREKY